MRRDGQYSMILSIVINTSFQGLIALCIHGDKEQREREWILNGSSFNFIKSKNASFQSSREATPKSCLPPMSRPGDWVCNYSIIEHHQIPLQSCSDVSDIKYVINYDYPNNSEDYVHRIGRTGRQNKTVGFGMETIIKTKLTFPLGDQLHILHVAK
jgi:hypothetical protein